MVDPRQPATRVLQDRLSTRHHRHTACQSVNTERTPAGRSPNSWAGGGLFNTYFWLDATAGITGLILTQILPFCDRSVLRLFERFESEIYSSRA